MVANSNGCRRPGCRFGQGWQVILGLIVIGGLAVQGVSASTLGFSTAETSNYLLVGTGSITLAHAVDVDNRRIGGNIAITHPNGSIELSNVIVNGTIDVRHNDSSKVNLSNVTHGGVNFNVNFDTLLSDLATAKTWIESQSATQTRTSNITSNTTITLVSGLNIIDLGVSGSDFQLTNATLTIAGPSDAVAIFRVVNGKSFQAANAIIDNQTGGHDNVLFYSPTPGAVGQAFDLNNMRTYAGNTPSPDDIPGILNVAFWALGLDAEINIDNALGCTQLIADKINLNNVDFDLCAFNPDIPPPGEPPVIPLPLAAWGGLVLMGGMGSVRWFKATRKQA